jgi:hypothetical protein
MEVRELEIGDVVQLGPNTANPMFAFTFMTVTEPKSWGAQGYVQALGEDGTSGGQAYYRAKFEDMELVGKAVWRVE